MVWLWDMIDELDVIWTRRRVTVTGGTRNPYLASVIGGRQ